MSEPIIMKYKELPPRIKEAMKNLKIKAGELKEIKKVYWGAYILTFNHSAGWYFNVSEMLKNEVKQIENHGSVYIAIKPEMREHDVVRLTKEIIEDDITIPMGAEGTIVTPIKDKICMVEFPDYHNAVVVVSVDILEVKIYY